MLLQLVGPVLVGMIGAAGVVVGALLPRLLPHVRNRNDRAMALQEAELLSKIKPDTEAADQLDAIIRRRIRRWHQKMFPSPKEDNLGQAVEESFEPYEGPTPWWVRVVQVAIVILFGSLLVAIIVGFIIHGVPLGSSCKGPLVLVRLGC